MSENIKNIHGKDYNSVDNKDNTTQTEGRLKRGKARRRLAAALELPEEAFGETPCLSLRGNTMMLWNCGEVLCYEDGHVKLTLLGPGGRKYVADVCGTGLYMRSFLDGTVAVEGNITRFELSSVKI